LPILDVVELLQPRDERSKFGGVLRAGLLADLLAAWLVA
jgi:hypothetical protein